MRKIAVLIAVLIVSVFAAGCYNDGRGTYYPSFDELKANLSKRGYEIASAQEDIGRSIHATKGKDFIVYYWLSSPEAAEVVRPNLEKEYPDTPWHSVINDKKHGNLIYCGTEKAIDDSGIQVVEVNV